MQDGTHELQGRDDGRQQEGGVEGAIPEIALSSKAASSTVVARGPTQSRDDPYAIRPYLPHTDISSD